MIIANDAKHNLGLDRLLMVVAREPWQKPSVEASAKQRYEMCVLATADEPGIEVSRIEMDRDGPTYTIDTIKELALPGDELFLIVGKDTRKKMSEWKDIETVYSMVILEVYDRWVGISSTEIRRRVLHGMPLKYIIPDPVIAYIQTEGLYQYGHPWEEPND